MSRDCPQCGNPLIAPFKSCACGWGAPKRAEREQPRHDGFCSWHANGKRCRYPGSLSSNTNGAGPWYCRYHFGCTDPVIGAQILDESQEYKPVTKGDQEREHSEAVAKRLKAKGLDQKAGETRGQYIGRLRNYINASMRQIAAREATREPGEDEAEAA